MNFRDGKLLHLLDIVQKKALHLQGFYVCGGLTAQPGINGGCTVLFLPGLQAAMVATLGLDQLAGVRVLIDLDHASTALLGATAPTVRGAVTNVFRKRTWSNISRSRFFAE